MVDERFRNSVYSPVSTRSLWVLNRKLQVLCELCLVGRPVWKITSMSQGFYKQYTYLKFFLTVPFLQYMAQDWKWLEGCCNPVRLKWVGFIRGHCRGPGFVLSPHWSCHTLSTDMTKNLVHNQAGFRKLFSDFCWIFKISLQKSRFGFLFFYHFNSRRDLEKLFAIIKNTIENHPIFKQIFLFNQKKTGNLFCGAVSTS